MKSFIFSFISLWTWLLTFTSGFANVISLLLLNGASSHHTGNISKMAIAICEKDMETIIFMLFLVGSFFLALSYPVYYFMSKNYGHRNDMVFF